MILLETSNRILEEAIASRINSGKAEVVDITFADFDGVLFHVATVKDQNNLLNISIGLKGGSSLLNEGGGLALLKQYYQKLLLPTPEGSYNATLQINLEQLPPNPESLPFQIANFKRHLFAAPFQQVFTAIENKTAGSNILAIQYRPEEAVYIKPGNSGDSVTVIFDILFRDADDIVLSKVFLQEFADARKTISNAPSVTFSQKEPPLELKGLKGVRAGDNNGFVSIVLFSNHISAKNRDKTINNIIIFRDYLHYHIKCSKAYMHTRMRNRVDSLLQILNRARPEPVEVVKKTAQGKTFKLAAKKA